MNDKDQKKIKIDKFKTQNKEFGKEEEKHFWKNIGKVGVIRFWNPRRFRFLRLWISFRGFTTIC